MKFHLSFPLSLALILCLISTHANAQYPSKKYLTPETYKRLLDENKLFKSSYTSLRNDAQRKGAVVSRQQNSIDSILSKNSKTNLTAELSEIQKELDELRKQLATNTPVVIPKVQPSYMGKLEAKEWKKRIKYLSEPQYSSLISENNLMKGYIQTEGEKLKSLEVKEKVNEKHLELLRKLFSNVKRSEDKDTYTEEH